MKRQFKNKRSKYGFIFWDKMKSKAILLCFVVTTAFLLFSCAGGVNGVPEPRSAPESDIEAGRRLIASYGCGSCHSIPGVPGADAMAAPPLGCFFERTYIAGRLPNTEQNLMRWIENPQEMEPGTAMPNLGVSKEEAHDIASYLYHPPVRWLFMNNRLARKCS